MAQFRPAGANQRQQLFHQTAGLRQHFGVAARCRAQDEFRNPTFDKGGDARDDRLGVADSEMPLRIAARVPT